MTNICKKILLIAVICGISFCVTSCGRYSAPQPVEGSGYPHNYPQD